MSKLQQYLIVIGLALIAFFLIRVGDHTKSTTQMDHVEMLSGFEAVKPWDFSPKRGFTLRRSGKNVTEGKYSLEVVFPKVDQPGINTKKLKSSWGEYEYFSVDVYNPQKEDIDFVIRLDDDSTRRMNIPYTLHAGWNKIRIPQTQIVSKINATEIKVVSLFLNEPRQKVRLYFDNMRLERPVLLAALDQDDLRDDKASVVSREKLSTRKAGEVPTKELPAQGSITVPLAKLRPVQDNNPLISAGVPFGSGQLKDEQEIAFFDKEEKEIPIAVKVLARWPQDKSIRSILVQFRYPIEKIYQYVTMKWGYPRKTKDLKIVEPLWEYPEGFIVLPAEWLCDSQVTGEQIPLGQHVIPLYDGNIEENFERISGIAWTGDLRKDGYYSTPHVFYQLYARSGDLKYFLAARKELLHYRENQIIHEGKEKGQSTAGTPPRYVYMEAMADDYFLTGDLRTLEVAGEMVGYLEKNFNPKDGYYSKRRTNFWTERKHGAAFSGFLTYFEMTDDSKYFKLAQEYMKNLYRTQLEWPTRGGFIHNLYAHDPEEGGRPDEYGGSPFMTGLLLEPIIKYHRLTGSGVVADSIFRALDWIIKEGLVGSGDSFKYLTADKYLNYGGDPDVNLLVVHAFGYGYRMSGYQNKEYLNVGLKVFDRGVREAFLRQRKHFNQNYRSSGHFFAYIKGGVLKGEETALDAGRREGLGADEPAKFGNLLHFEDFEFSLGRFNSPGDATPVLDSENVYLNGKSLKVESNFMSSNLSFGIELDDWDIDEYPRVSFSYRIPAETPVGMRIQTRFGDWICVGGTPQYQCVDTLAKESLPLVNDGEWHEIDVNIQASARSVLGKIKRLQVFQFYTNGNAKKGDCFWFDDFKVRK